MNEEAIVTVDEPSSSFSNSSPKCVIDYSYQLSPSHSYPQKIIVPSTADVEEDSSSTRASSIISTNSSLSSFLLPPLLLPTNNANSNIEIIHSINQNDVLCGRGRGPAMHSGNIRFRELVARQRATYLTSKDRKEKARICRDIVDTIQSSTPPGRFLKQTTLSPDNNIKVWVRVGNDKARMKTGQALREGCTRDMIHRAQLLSNVAGIKRNMEVDAPIVDCEKKKSNNKRLRIDSTNDSILTIYTKDPEKRERKVPLKKYIMRKAKEDMLRDNMLAAWMDSKGYL